MPRIRLLASAVAMAICSISTAVASTASVPVFTSFTAFGDSLSDSGNVAAFENAHFGTHFPPGTSFTTNPDPVTAQIIAGAFGFSADPSLAGGTDFAWGGACVGTGPCESDPNPTPNLGIQIGQYLTATGGKADATGLYSYWGGANDIFGNFRDAQSPFNPGGLTAAQIQANIAGDAHLAVGQIAQLHNAGAGNIIVFNLPNLAITPDANAQAAQLNGFIPGAGTQFLQSLAKVTLLYNGQLNGGLSGKTGIIPVDVFGLVNEVLAHPSTYGFNNVTVPACQPYIFGTTSSLACGPAGSGAPFQYAAGTDLTSFFADGVHPTGGGHALLAEAVLAEIQAPSIVSMLAETPLQTFETSTRAIHNQMEADMSRERTDGNLRSFASFDYTRQRYDATATSPNTTSDDSSLVIGTDYYVNNQVSLGLSSTFSHQSASFAGGGRFQNNEPLVTVFGVWHTPEMYVSLLGSAGQLNFNGVTRNIQLGSATRSESGSTSGSHLGYELSGGYFFRWDELKTGPFASISNQRVTVGSYNENGNDSTAMVFGRQTRNSLIESIGWELTGNEKMFNGEFRPFARVAYDHESDTHVRNVSAGLVGLNGTFSMPGYRPDSSWWNGELGVSAAFGSNLTGYAAYNGVFGNSNVRADSINVGMKYSW